jgi:hypothetical protein
MVNPLDVVRLVAHADQLQAELDRRFTEAINPVALGDNINRITLALYEADNAADRHIGLMMDYGMTRYLIELAERSTPPAP